MYYDPDGLPRRYTAVDLGADLAFAGIFIGLAFLDGAYRDYRRDQAKQKITTLIKQLEGGQYDEVIRQADRLITDSNQQKQLGGHYLKVLALVRTGRPEDYRRAIAECTAGLELAQHLDSESSASGFYIQRGYSYYQAGEIGPAIRDCTTYIKQHPDHAYAYVWRGVAFLDLDDLDQALSDLTDAVRLAPGDILPYRMRAEVYVNRNELSNAIDDLSRALKLDPNDASTNQRRVQLQAYLAEKEHQAGNASPDAFLSFLNEITNTSVLAQEISTPEGHIPLETEEDIVEIIRTIKNTEDEETREIYINSLAQDVPTHHNESAATFLILEKVLQDPSPKVRLAVCKAIVRCVMVLREFDNDIRELAATRAFELFKLIQDDVDPIVRQLVSKAQLDLVMLQAMGDVAQIPESFEQMFRRVAQGDEDNRVANVEALAMDSEASPEELNTTFEVLQSMTQDPYPKVRAYVCKAIVRWAVLHFDSDIDTRQRTTMMALRILEPVENDVNPAVRRWALAARMTLNKTVSKSLEELLEKFPTQRAFSDPSTSLPLREA